MLIAMKFLKKVKNNKYFQRGLIVVGIGLLVFTLINLVLLIIYKDKTYPGTTIQNYKLGSANQTGLQNKLSKTDLVPETIKLTYNETTADVKTENLGIKLDTGATAKQAVKQKSWLPVINFISPPKVEVKTSIDQAKFNSQAEELAKIFNKAPQNAKVELKDGTFLVIKESNGYELNKPELLVAIHSALEHGSAIVTAPVKITEASVKETDLAGSTQDLSERTKVLLTYKFKDKTRKLTPEEIAGLHEPNETTYILSESKIRNLIISIGKSWGIGVQNIDQAVRDTKSSIQNKTNAEISLVEAPKKTYNYCVSLRGVDSGELSGFQNKINAVLNDNRGWSLDGQVQFVKASSGCSFTVWLSSASQMPTFGAICDADWSCAVSPNVVVNYDRWRFGSNAWNNGGGSLEDYRAMVINHETGHQLGFGHRNCGGAGQPAPVMQQQSISLQGCVFNPWPNAAERDTLRKNLGL